MAAFFPLRSIASSLLVLALLTGCTTTSESLGPESEAAWRVRQPALESFQNWEFIGRVAVQREEEGWFASLHWKQRGTAYRLQVSGPAGQGAARLNGDDVGVSLIRGDGTVYLASRPEELLATHLGWQVPVTGLRYWIRGVPTPTEWESRALDAAGHLVRLRQDGWDIHFDRYSAVDTLELPGRLVLERPPLTVRIIMERWSLNASD
ncbi:Outer-membrane lipoprotein LolB [Gammaproteobacteria bacterium]